MAVETALARQLKNLAVPQTTVLIQDKIRKSLIHHHRDAAALDQQAFFDFGTTGLQKLRNLYPSFNKFEFDLFSLSYKDFQRSVQTADVNKKLDAKITEFLRLVSPFFLLREAHEALDWLIYRFNIHLYNVDELVASAIPHYNTAIFVSVVQLLDLNEKSRWFWLKPVQKTNVPLEYSAVLNRFLSDAGFRKFICDIAPNVLKVYKGHEHVAIPIVSFSTITIFNALEKSKVIDDSLVTFLIPYILEGLSSDFTKYTSASYFIIVKVLSCVKLNLNIVEKLLLKVFETLKKDLMVEACKIILLAFQTQSIKSLPDKVFSVILSDNHCEDSLFCMFNELEAAVLIRATIKKAVFMYNIRGEVKGTKIIKFVEHFFSNVRLDEKCVMACFNAVIKKFSKISLKEKAQEEIQHFKKIAKCIFKNLEQMYPEYFDKAYKRFLEQKSKLNKIVLCNFINKSVCSMKYEMVPNIKTSLSLGLYHANSQIRQTSFTYLLERIANDESIDKEFASKVLNDGLLDSCPTVVLEILSSINVFLPMLGESMLLLVFKHIFTKEVQLESKWYSVQMKCLEIITKMFKGKNVDNILELILNFLFPVNEHTLAGFLHVMKADFQNKFLQEMKLAHADIIKSDVAKDKIFKINCRTVKCLKKFVEEMTKEARMEYISLLDSKIANSKSISLVVFYLYVMQFTIVSCEDVKISLLLIDNFLKMLRCYFLQTNTIAEKFEILSEEDVIERCINSLNKQQFPATLVYNTFYKVVTGLNLETECKSWPDVESGYGDAYEILSKLINFCVLHSSSDKKVLQEYFISMLSLLMMHQFKDIQSMFWFLSTKLLKDSEKPQIQLAAIDILSAFCEQQAEMDWLFDNAMIFFSIVKVTSHSLPKLGQSALALLSLCLNSAKDCKHPLKFLADELIKRSEEIKIDSSQCYNYIGNWLKAAAEYNDAKKPSRASKELQNKITILNQMLNLIEEKNVPYSAKHFFLSCLQNIDSASILSTFIPVLYAQLSLLGKSISSKQDILSVLHLLIKKFTSKTAVCLTETSEESKALLHCLNFTIGEETDMDRSVQVLTLDVLNKDFFSAIASVKVQLEIFENLLSLYLTSPVEVNAKVEKVLRDLCPYAYLFIQHIQEKHLVATKSTSLREAKKSKTKDSGADGFNTIRSRPWKEITVLLELIQSESNLFKKEILIPELFNLLHKSINYESEAQVEYIKQLILSAIHNCYEQLSVSPQQKLECEFRVEVITLCIRTSTNPKTHHQALLLLNLGASMFPDRVLENVMSIFVFMGSSLVRQDDSYSFQVLSQIIETIMPSLLEASNQLTETDDYEVVAPVIRVFVDSLLDIPGHRQLPLFTKVINTLNPSKYLWVPLGQICDRYGTSFHDITADDSDHWEVSPALEFAVNLNQQFLPDIQIDTCISLIKFLLKLPDNKNQIKTDPAKYKKIKEPFDVEARSDKQLQTYKQNVLCYTKLWLSSHAFHNQIAELSVKQQSSLEDKYEVLLESVLDLLQDRLNVKKSGKSQIKVDDQIQLLYDLVDAINSLLPCNLFIRVIRRLLKNENADDKHKEEIQMRAIELLNTKLEQQRDMIYVENHKLLLKLMKPILKLANTCLDENDKDDKNIVLQQNALYSLHLLCKLIGPKYPTKFYKVLRVSVAILNQYDKPELVVNALLCIAQLCYCLNVDILPHMNSFMPFIISILQNKKLLNLHECLIVGVITALNSIIENLGIFLSSYIEDIIINICLHSVTYSELGKKAVSEKFVSLQTKLSHEIPLRVLINAIINSYSKLSRKNANSVVPLMNILTQSLESTKCNDIMSCATELQNIYIHVLDFRNSNQLLPAETVCQVENCIISSLVTFVMKLSVTQFRTFFQKIYQWTTVLADDQEQKFRIFTFYKTTGEFSKTLKNLFSVMSKYFFTHISSILNACNFSKSETHYFDSDVKLSHELLVNALDTLSNCFMNAEEQLLDKENFELLMQPLVDQIENLHDETMYQDLIEKHLNSCVAYFMAAVSDGVLWKSLNYQILLKVRHASPKVRFGALQVILEVVRKMGDNYLVLLPESIPFLAEMMEDDCVEVEQECQTVIVEMEKILGEPIRKYF